MELDISPKVAGEEEAEEWLLASPEKKKQRRSGSSRRCRISTRIKGVPEERGGTTNKSRGSPHDPTMRSRPCDPTARSLHAACPRNPF